jgi:hypothetical protein
MEEVTIPGSSLYLDLYLPLIPLAVEVHGKQHYEHIPFFHKTKADFLLSQKRDKDKANWAEFNHIFFVVLPYDKEYNWWELINLAISQD